VKIVHVCTVRLQYTLALSGFCSWVSICTFTPLQYTPGTFQTLCLIVMFVFAFPAFVVALFRVSAVFSFAHFSPLSLTTWGGESELVGVIWKVETTQKCPRLSVQICFTNNRIFPCKHDQLSVVGLFLYHLLFPHMKSDSFQNLPFCDPKRGQQGHTLLAAVIPTSPQSSFKPFPLLPTLSHL